MMSRRWPPFVVGMAIAVTMPLLAACDSGGTGDGGSVSDPSSGSSGPIAVEVNQSRDQYGKQAILLQLTNTTDAPLTVTAARLRSTLFADDISWEPSEGGLELPPRQPKSLPAILPAAACETSGDASPELNARITYAAPGKEPAEGITDASDPFDVLTRNAGELCLATEVAAVAAIVLDPALEVAADGRTAVVRLVITPATPGGSANTLTIESIDGTTLLAEAPSDPWPRNVTIAPGDSIRDLALRIRPARCDPHAVAEDKVGTLLPLRITVGERQGSVKIAASNELRGRIYDFVTAACATAG
ncbi:hypothetical protein [Paenarthrobacter sp. 4246]|uniref:hypothetical protein n=1 Tax=Paenarthrobacter sp. 4246 TaxID=3156456 RepID=UPI003394E23E